MNGDPEYKNEEIIENNTDDTISKKKSPFARIASLLDYFEIFALSVLAVLLVFTVFFRVCRVDGSSMNNTLSNGETLIISDVFYEPRQGDIVVFHLCQGDNGFNQPLIKRVIATEGQQVVIDLTDRKVFVDGIELIEEYAYFKNDIYSISYFNYNNLEFDEDGHTKYIVTVPEGKLFVMGDNRNGSTDSRSKSVGFVDKDCILGKALFRLAPFTILTKN